LLRGGFVAHLGDQPDGRPDQGEQQYAQGDPQAGAVGLLFLAVAGGRGHHRLAGGGGHDRGRVGDGRGGGCRGNGRGLDRTAEQVALDVRAHRGRRLVALVEPLGQGLHHDRVYLRRQVRVDRRRRYGGFADVLVGHRDRGL